MTEEFLRASLDNDRQETERLLQASVPRFWPDCDSLLRLRLQQLADDPSLQVWLLRAIVLESAQVMVGHIGFHSAPNAEYLEHMSPGAVEFGFTVFAPYRRRGYAREAAVALMDWARKEHLVRRFVLSIRPDNVASLALAASLGFVRIGSHVDEVDGLEEVFELNEDFHSMTCR